MTEKIASELAEAISLIECEFLTEFLIRDSSITAALSFGMTAWGDKGLEGKNDGELLYNSCVKKKNMSCNYPIGVFSIGGFSAILCRYRETGTGF